jgi:hypothetical protein
VWLKGSLDNSFLALTILTLRGIDMSSSSEEFARYAKAERQLCDDAAPVLAAIISRPTRGFASPKSALRWIGQIALTARSP